MVSGTSRGLPLFTAGSVHKVRMRDSDLTSVPDREGGASQFLLPDHSR